MQEIDIEKEKREILNKYKSLLRACADKTDKSDKKEIRKAFNLAVEAHKNMRRKNMVVDLPKGKTKQKQGKTKQKQGRTKT